VNERGLENYEVEKSADGQHFTKAAKVGAQNNNAASYAWLDASPVKGQNFYRIKTVNKDGSVSYSQVLLVNLSGSKGGFVFYPNPAKGRTVSIQLSNLEKGKYTLTVFNNIGQQVMERQIDHTGGSAAQTVDFDKQMAAGIYRVELIKNDGTGKTQQQTLILQ
jgi:hypothetical protein